MVGLTPFGVFFIIVAAIMIISTVIQYARKRITAAWAMWWSGVWVVGSVMMFFTGVIDRVSQVFFGVEARLSAVYVAILLLFALVYRVIIMLQEVRRDQSRIVEELAKQKR